MNLVRKGLTRQHPELCFATLSKIIKINDEITVLRVQKKC
jgi:hypothetical protein